MQAIYDSPNSGPRSGVTLAPVSILLDQPRTPLSPPKRATILPLSDGPTPVLIMVGLDDKGKPHASWFAGDQAAAATAAADLMDMALIAVNTEELATIAAKLPQGRLFESGKAFVPFVKRETYDLLAAYLDDDFVAASAERVEATAAASAASYAKASQGESAPRQPEDWSKLTVGDRVLASDGPGDGWYEADVQEALPEERFRLRWRDWPEIGDFTRSVTDIALLHPKHVDA